MVRIENVEYGAVDLSKVTDVDSLIGAVVDFIEKAWVPMMRNTLGWPPATRLQRLAHEAIKSVRFEAAKFFSTGLLTMEQRLDLIPKATSLYAKKNNIERRLSERKKFRDTEKDSQEVARCWMPLEKEEKSVPKV